MSDTITPLRERIRIVGPHPQDKTAWQLELEGVGPDPTALVYSASEEPNTLPAIPYDVEAASPQTSDVVFSYSVAELAEVFAEFSTYEALVLERPDGTWVYQVAGKAVYELGRSFGDAKIAIDALVAAHKAFLEENPGERG